MNTPKAMKRVLEIFSELNAIPRPSHYEERVADYICDFARRLSLEYERNEENCVVVRKPATAGYEFAEPVVLLNHMDMVCVGMPDPLNTPVQAYVGNGWMKARGTSLGADNGIGLAMALAVLEDDSLVHGPIEVLTTTNEEDGMSGASSLSHDFIKGRKVINLDSEDYDTITTGAAGALMQEHRFAAALTASPGGKKRWYRITIEGGRGGHSGVDINKGRLSAVIPSWAILAAIFNEYDFDVADIRIGESSASIATSAEIVVCVPSGEASEFVKQQEENMNEWLREEYGNVEPDLHCTIRKCEKLPEIIGRDAVQQLLTALEQTPQGVIEMSKSMPDTVHTSNNVGRILLEGDKLLVTTHTRSFSYDDMLAVGKDIADVFSKCGAQSAVVMQAPSWQENQQSDYLALVSDTFNDVLGWRPRKVAMHFVLEAGFLVEKYPGIEIACIGPRIVEPHSCNERVELSTVDDIWRVLLEMLSRMAGMKQ